MHIFIDESGTFSDFQNEAISAVGALAIPSRKIKYISKRYLTLRKNFPLTEGEVKGRTLNEKQIAAVIKLLEQNDVIFEATVIDLSVHEKNDVAAYQTTLVKGMRERLPLFNDTVRPTIAKSLDDLEATPQNLFLQTMGTFDLLHNVLSHVPLYFVQRIPRELGNFCWVIDGKDKQKVTNWERWWAEYALGALSTKSRTSPAPHLEGEDYSYFKQYSIQNDEGEEGTDLGLLMNNLHFSSKAEIGLELVDILVNSLRRAIVGNLGTDGWKDLPRLMIHRRGEQYVSFIRLTMEYKRIGRYSNIVNPRYAEFAKRFRHNGKSMLTERNLTLASIEEKLHKSASLDRI